jgi:hypothetical protein
MEFKVREVTGEQKSVQEMENLLLKKHEEQINGAQSQLEIPLDNPAPVEPVAVVPEIKDEDVLSYIGKRFNKEIKSFDELMSERTQEDMPEDVSAFLKFKKETGRGIQDFIKVNEDIDSLSDDDVIKRYLKSTNTHLDDDDIDVMMDEYRYDEDLDDESDIKKSRLAKKKVIAEAKNYLNQEREKYKAPLESRMGNVSQQEKEEFEAYKRYIDAAKSEEEETQRRLQWFEKQTGDVFNQEFKGFEFNVDDKSLRFSPGDATELKKLHSNPSNFIAKYLDENGLLKDSVGYHRALAVAMNPEKFAKFFYEQGKAEATDDVTRKIKNINMSERQAPQTTAKEGVQIREMNPDSGKGLKIRSIKKL